MARRPASQVPRSAFLSAVEIDGGIERLEKRLADLRKFDPSTVVEQSNIPQLDRLRTAIDDALSRTFGADTHEYESYKSAAEFDNGPFNYAYEVPIHEVQASINRSKGRNIAILEAVIEGLRERRAEIDLVQRATAATGKTAGASRKVFVVHGHDEGALQGLARFLEQLRLETIILREQPDQGRTIIEKFEDCATDVGFAVVLLTPDDVGGSVTTQDQARRARQNVVFELGYFAGKLGRGRTCLLRKEQVEIPSDLYGVIYTEMDEGDGWKLKLVRELKAAKLDFDANRVWV